MSEVAHRAADQFMPDPVHDCPWCALDVDARAVLDVRDPYLVEVWGDMVCGEIRGFETSAWMLERGIRFPSQPRPRHVTDKLRGRLERLEHLAAAKREELRLRIAGEPPASSTVDLWA